MNHCSIQTDWSRKWLAQSLRLMVFLRKKKSKHVPTDCNYKGKADTHKTLGPHQGLSFPHIWDWQQAWDRAKGFVAFLFAQKCTKSLFFSVTLKKQKMPNPKRTQTLTNTLWYLVGWLESKYPRSSKARDDGKNVVHTLQSKMRFLRHVELHNHNNLQLRENHTRIHKVHCISLYRFASLWNSILNTNGAKHSQESRIDLPLLI